MSVNLGSGGSYSRGSGRSGAFARRRSYGAMAEINVTNLVDVMLVLLIIFMISAPLLQSGIEVKLPKSASTAVNPEEDGVIVSIDSKGGIFIGDTWARLENFEDQLKGELQKISSESVFLRADSLVSYGIVVDVISRLKSAGIANLGLITEPLDSRSQRKKNAGKR